MALDLIEGETQCKTEPTIEESHLIEQPKRPYFCLFHNYHNIAHDYRYIIERTYEAPLKWYFLTFKPFDKGYAKDTAWYQKKGIDHCRDKIGKAGKAHAYYLTRETKATKTHINALVLSESDLSKLHEKKTNKYFIYCEAVNDRFKVFDYIFKESRERYFNQYIDFAIYSK